ncbi:hypothetical protein [Anaplasma marginale]|uniref:hypothetical protein n=1 Tax=Anaplasma marginale TaxID=770 RepID=UPI00030EBD02|nr:hypothetical protein [Anaplasma marginale]
MQVNRNEIAQATEDLCHYFEKTQLDESSKIMTLLGYLAEFIVFGEGETPTEDRIEIFTDILINKAKNYLKIIKEGNNYGNPNISNSA